MPLRFFYQTPCNIFCHKDTKAQREKNPFVSLRLCGGISFLAEDPATDEAGFGELGD
jgi:hypothetical protein